MITSFIKDKRRKAQSEQLQPMGTAWKGYEAKKLMDMLHKAQERGLDETAWRDLLEQIIFTLSPYYDKIVYDLKQEHTSMVPMLSVRQMITFKNTLYELSKSDIWAAIREWTDFIDNYGEYKNHYLSEIETYMTYVLAQQIVNLMYKKGR